MRAASKVRKPREPAHIRSTTISPATPPAAPAGSSWRRLGVAPGEVVMVAPSARLPLGPRAQQLGDDYRLVVVAILRAVQQGNGLAASQLTQAPQALALVGLVQLGAVAPAELLPARRIVPEPLAQLGAGPQLRQPFV